ncbi:MAG: TonB-dependent receptor [Gemmatimonadales bacterium]
MRSLVITAVACAIACAPLCAQAVEGRLVDAATGNPIEGAWVALLRRARPVETDLTDADGRFSLPIPNVDLYRLRAERIGFGTALTPPILFSNAERVGLTFRLHAQAVELDPIDVVGESSRPAAIPGGFAQRAERGGLGYFVTREEIEARNPHLTTDLLRDVPGVRIVGDNVAVGRRGRTRERCEAEVMVDGTRQGTAATSIDDLVDPARLYGIEVYTRSFDVPPELATNPPCGLIGLWTMR